MTRQSAPEVDALVLSGGNSRRMGRPKALLRLPDGLTLAEAVGRRVAAVAGVALEVGGGWSRLPWCPDHISGAGPLGAVVTGWRALRDQIGRDPRTGVLVVAVDLPLVSVELLTSLAAWEHPGSVVLALDGRPQPLLARWSDAALAEATRRFDQGERRVTWLVQSTSTLVVPETDWAPLAGPTGADSARDVDDPEAWATLLARLGHVEARAEAIP
jgi:molybdopterin-guanine dinucleotide biosynthesis protein A